MLNKNQCNKQIRPGHFNMDPKTRKPEPTQKYPIRIRTESLQVLFESNFFTRIDPEPKGTDPNNPDPKRTDPNRSDPIRTDLYPT